MRLRCRYETCRVALPIHPGKQRPGPPEELPCSFSSILLLLMAGHELPAALGGGIVEYLLRSADLFHLSLMQEHHLTGHLTGKAHLVGNQQHSTSFFGQSPD